MSHVSTKNKTKHINIRKHEGMHDSHFYENEKKHEVAICENKHAWGRPKGKGYMIAAMYFAKTTEVVYVQL